MSGLVGLALRLTARKLLDGATFAGGRVYDSAIAPIDHMVTEGNDEPFILISTEDEEASNFTLRDITGGTRTIDLVIEVAIAHSISGEDGGNEIVIPSTDAGFELSISLISRQIMRALFEQKDSPWDLLFKRFCLGIDKVTSRRGVGNKDGSRFAARQFILTINCLQEPHFGHEPLAGEPWGDLLEQLNNDPDLSAVAPLIRQTITGTPPISDWDSGRSEQGLTDEAAERIGLRGPNLPDEEPPLLNDVDMNAETEVQTDGGFTV